MTTLEKKYWRSGELSKLAGVSSDTLRHYERKGLLARPQRSSNGYREYPPGAIDRVRLIQRALGVGFTIEELAQILAERDRGGAPCRQVRALAAKKLDELERDLDDLIALRGELRELLKHWDKLLDGDSTGGHARLLENFAEAISTKHRRSLSTLRPNRRTKILENEE
jgi:MerR family transcriptional regulator, mercuric resistance operon regulatory protein